MVAYVWRHQCARIITLVALGALISGCKTIEGGPARLYTANEEVAIARDMLPSLRENYDNATTDAQRIYFRNEYIARRMYIIDVEYSDYEVALTSERQIFGFATSTASNWLGLASTLVTPIKAAQIVGGVGTGIGAVRGFYDSEVVIAKTIQIAQGHMRAQRDDVARRQILPRRLESTLTYPMSAALHDLEDYYRAGTLTAGLIQALGESGEAAKDAATAKAAVIRGTFGSDDASVTLTAFLRPGGTLNRPRLKRVNECLARFGVRPASILRHLDVLENPASATIRLQGLRCAQQDPEFTG
jgi:hypothetical protein